MADQFDNSVRFADWVRHLRFWLAKNRVADRGKVRIEIMFPDARSQHHAICALRREMTPQILATSGYHIGAVETEGFEFEGVKLIFTNPERWDKRRA